MENFFCTPRRHRSEIYNKEGRKIKKVSQEGLESGINLRVVISAVGTPCFASLADRAGTRVSGGTTVEGLRHVSSDPCLPLWSKGRKRDETLFQPRSEDGIRYNLKGLKEKRER